MMKILAAILICLFGFSAQSKDFGVYGEIYPIEEENLLSVIKSRLSVIEENGGFDELKQDLKNKAENNRDRPKSVLTSKAKETKTWLLDPSVTLNKDLKDQNGKVFAQSGKKINPLNHISLSKTLYFIDGDDDSQLIWLLKQGMKLNDKVILTNGSVLNAEKQLDRVVYFDQNGELIKRFKLKVVPSVVSQKGNMLLIQEVYLSE